MPERPDYSKVAATYGTSRPKYPRELFAWLASVAPRHDAAWDTATGSGQAAIGLAADFRRVIATDVSEAQLRHAEPHERVDYRVASAEDSGLPDRSVDLVAAAAAFHWFDRPRFYAEVRRVATEGAVLAVWTYHVAHLEPPFDRVLGPFYENVVRDHFAPGARLVDDRYEGIDLPGAPLTPPPFVVSARWNLARIAAFVRTWSGVQTYVEKTGTDPVTALTRELAGVCGDPERLHELRWPVYLRASRL